MRAFIFDLDGTLVDTVYEHALAWQAALAEIDIVIPTAETHRLIGMAGKPLAMSVARARGRHLTAAEVKRLESRHAAMYRAASGQPRPLPGAIELLGALSHAGIPHGIATSGKREELGPELKSLKLSSRTKIVDGSKVRHAKPEPDLFIACQKALRVTPRDCLIVGDSVWDIHAARRSGIPAVGVLTGGFGEQELHNAGAMLVYSDLEDLHGKIDQLGFSLQ